MLVVEKVVVGGGISSSSSLFSFNHPPAITKVHFPSFANYRINTITRRGRGGSCLAPVVVVKAGLSSIGGGGVDNKKVPSANYVVPFDSSSCITRPLGEILRDLNKRIPDNITVKKDFDGAENGDGFVSKPYIPWYHANRMLSFYAPGWCGEIRDVIFSDNGSVTVVYRVTIRGSDGEAHRESTGTVSPAIDGRDDAVAAAEEIAFCRACARFGLGLYLYHDE